MDIQQVGPTNLAHLHPEWIYLAQLQLGPRRPVLAHAPINFSTPGDAGGAKPGNKRKKEDEVIGEEGSPSKSKRARRYVSLREALFELPIELLQEVFGHLEPLDLLHLSRTSKQLREFILNRSSRVPIWQRSFANFVPAIPQCPHDLTEPAYAELAFGVSCHICSANSKEAEIEIVWGARIRACRACRNKTDGYFHKVSSKDRPYGRKLLDILRRATFPWRRHNPVVYKPLDLALFAEFRKLESRTAKKEWVAIKIKEWELNYEHARLCMNWLSLLEMRYSGERRKAIKERKAIVVERVKALGWEEELSLLSTKLQYLENLPVVAEACSKDLTEQVLSRLEGHAVKHLAQLRASRLKAERQLVLRPRLAALKAFHKICVKSLPVDAIHPTASELFRVKSVWNIINDVPATVPFTQHHLAPVRDDFDNIIREWREDIEDQLLELLSPGLSDIKDPAFRRKTFKLATSTFSCSYPGCSRFLRYPEVMMHACATKPHHGDDFDIDIQIMNGCLNQSFWNFNRCITVNPEHIALVHDLLIKVDIDPLTATGRHWDLAIYECTSCYRDATGRAFMTFGHALVHCFDPEGVHSDGQDYNIVPIQSSKTDPFLRPEMQHAARLDQRNDRSYNFVCEYCKEEGNFTVLREHMYQAHDSGDLRFKDSPPWYGPQGPGIAYRIDADQTVPLYRLLPPKASTTTRQRNFWTTT
ncbi:hypothetical protein M413DRAFT_21747 [Hebeloma cylindrosporum]|uniref:F-box domain-containing protein n=1 Tax=Hebeloma cylindrosporum TaxID=76867 RepID=A0A0C3D0A0_HEBCY|nr:hypothetical protein M413DRAFT_21747 [Hebeloma cylindrosporum h7]